MLVAKRFALAVWLCACVDTQPHGRADGDSGVATDVLADVTTDSTREDDPDGGCRAASDCEAVTCRQGDLELPCGACLEGACALCDEAADCHGLSVRWNACGDHARCVECQVDADCAGNPAALGPACGTSGAALELCVCAGDTDCQNHANGPMCLPDQGGYCGCRDDADCGDGGSCTTAGGIDVCMPSP